MFLSTCQYNTYLYSGIFLTYFFLLGCGTIFHMSSFVRPSYIVMKCIGEMTSRCFNRMDQSYVSAYCRIIIISKTKYSDVYEMSIYLKGLIYVKHVQFFFMGRK